MLSPVLSSQGVTCRVPIPAWREDSWGRSEVVSLAYTMGWGCGGRSVSSSHLEGEACVCVGVGGEVLQSFHIQLLDVGVPGCVLVTPL